MIVQNCDHHLIPIREYAVGTESYELGFSKGLIDPGESVYEAANRELKRRGRIWCERSDFFEEAQHGTVLLFQPNEYRGRKILPESLEGDEPEPLPQVRWPLAHMMDLLEDPRLQRSA